MAGPYYPKNIVILRENLRLNQTELAERIGAKRGAVAQWERGKNKPGALKVTKMAQLAGVTEHQFLNTRITLLQNPAKSSNGPPTAPPTNFNGDLPLDLTGGTLTMSHLISMSILDLQELQRQQDNIEMVKAIQEVITYKQYCEALQRENDLLQKMIVTKDQVIKRYESESK